MIVKKDFQKEKMYNDIFWIIVSHILQIKVYAMMNNYSREEWQNFEKKYGNLEKV